jgi:hypothetical protein
MNTLSGIITNELPTHMIDKKSKVLLCFLLIIILFSIAITYNQIVIQRDFHVIPFENSELTE